MLMERKRQGFRKILIGGVAMVVVAGATAMYILVRPTSNVAGVEPYTVSTASPTQLKQVAEMRVFFGHQSVGRNVLDAVPRVYAAAGLDAPDIIESTDPVGGAAIQHAYTGRNGDPLGKLEAFDSAIRGGLGEVIDVAVFKFCYVDLHAGDDAEALFLAYRDTMLQLERDYPEVSFLYATIPLTTERDAVGRAKDRVKRLLGRNVPYVPGHNVAREQLNSLIRAEFGDSGRLWDIAAVQAAGADGVRERRTVDGSVFFAMDDGLASDPGHLNPAGAEIVAGTFLATIAATTD